MSPYVNSALADFDLDKLVEQGERIYSQNYKSEFERRYFGKFAEIDIRSGKAYVGDTEHDAWKEAHEHSPHGFFYTVRIGYNTAYRM